MTAFDLIRPPAPDLIEDCVHCGFCLPSCPTYELWGEEMDSPRGRILLMRAGHEQVELSVSQVDAWDNCLGCMACVTACPSGVQYDKLIEDTRGQIERNYRRPWRERLHRRLIFALFPHPGRVRALAPLLWVQRVTGLQRVLARVLTGRAPRLAALIRLAPEVGWRDAFRRLPERTPAVGTTRARVGLLQGCVQRVFFDEVNRDTLTVLAAEGFEVWSPAAPRCCGALQVHSGDAEPARGLARETIAAFEGCDAIVVNAAGCGSSMKDYGHLLRDDPAWADRAAAFSAKVRDVTELLAEHGTVGPRHPLDVSVVYHDACHLAHAQGIRQQPRDLLAAIPGLELREPAEPGLCCGSAGIYNLIKPEPAEELGRRKARNLLDAGAQLVAAANPGCTLQIVASARELDAELRVVHPVTLLAASIQGRSVGAR